MWRRLDERYGTRAQTAIRFALANPDIACVVVGMAELGHLEEALAAAEMGPLPDEALAALNAVYESGFRAPERRRLRMPKAACSASGAGRLPGSLTTCRPGRPRTPSAPCSAD